MKLEDAVVGVVDRVETPSHTEEYHGATTHGAGGRQADTRARADTHDEHIATDYTTGRLTEEYAELSV